MNFQSVFFTQHIFYSNSKPKSFDLMEYINNIPLLILADNNIIIPITDIAIW